MVNILEWKDLFGKRKIGSLAIFLTLELEKSQQVLSI